VGDERDEATEDKTNVTVAKARKAAETLHEFAMPVVVTETPKSLITNNHSLQSLCHVVSTDFTCFLPNTQSRVNVPWHAQTSHSHSLLYLAMIQPTSNINHPK